MLFRSRPALSSATTPSAFRDLSDEALVSQTLSGNPDAFAEIVNRYKTAVVSYCYSRVRDRDTAEDLSQDVFLRAYQSMDKLKNTARLSTLLMSISHNRCIDFFRQKKNPVSLEAAARGGHNKTSRLRVDVPDEFQTPVEEKVIREETYRIVLDIISEMSDEYRVTLSLRYGNMLSCEEIASTLGVSIGTVTSRLSRAHAAIREDLEKLLSSRKGGANQTE